jgi:hypothetical protein
MSSKQATVLSTSVICKQPGRYIGWPTVGRMPNGELLVVFSGDRDAHVDPFGKTQLVRSADNGATWSPPTTINDTPLDDRDAGICVCRDGAVIVSWFTSHYTDEKYMQMCRDNREEIARRSAYLKAFDSADLVRWAGTELEDGRYRLGHWIRRSTDGARTWEAPVRVPPATPHGPIELDDGRLLFVGIETNHGRRERRGHLLAAESRDRGATWRVIGTITMFPPYPGDAPGGYAYFCEPHVTEVSPGKLVAMARYEELPRASERCRLWQFDSDDGGHTWTEPRELPILGKPPHLLTLHDGRILLTYGYRHPPFGQRACLSRDGGRTWDYDREIVLLDDAPSGDLGYPASVELADGSLYTVFYQQDQPGEKPCLMGIHWRLR